jgi:hypothetical protein
MLTRRLVAITFAIAIMAGGLAIVAYGYGVAETGVMNEQYPAYSNSWGPCPPHKGWGMMENNGQYAMGTCHFYTDQYSYMNHHWHRYCQRYIGNITLQPNRVLIIHHFFLPENITINKGDTVTWINLCHAVHTVELGTHDQSTPLFDSGPLYQGQRFSYTFTEQGVYTYHCDLHSSMVGTVIVQG